MGDKPLLSDAVAARLRDLAPNKRALLESRLLDQRARSLSGGTITRRSGTGPCPLSFSQEVIWLSEQMIPEPATYNVPIGLRLEGDLELSALKKALDKIVERHEVLRTVYVAKDGVPLQVVQQSRPVEWSSRDVSGASGAGSEVELKRICVEHARREFDLCSGPMIRAALLRLGPLDHLLLITTHHICFDGWSKRVL